MGEKGKVTWMESLVIYIIESFLTLATHSCTDFEQQALTKINTSNPAELDPNPDYLLHIVTLSFTQCWRWCLCSSPPVDSLSWKYLMEAKPGGAAWQEDQSEFPWLKHLGPLAKIAESYKPTGGVHRGVKPLSLYNSPCCFVFYHNSVVIFMRTAEECHKCTLPCFQTLFASGWSSKKSWMGYRKPVVQSQCSYE